MIGMLASVKSLEEALQIHSLGIDIIDLKQPSQGALGALNTTEVAKIVTALKPKNTLSATIGDLPMQKESVFEAVNNMAKTGVDYVKIGIFPQGNAIETIEYLSHFTQKGISLIAVLFADIQPDFKLLKVLKTANFTGAMLDTMDKKLGTLTDVMSLSEIQTFVGLTKDFDLLCGLAGSLKESDIKLLGKFNPDYLGFRGALCPQHDRVAQLNPKAIKNIQQAIKRLNQDGT